MVIQSHQLLRKFLLKNSTIFRWALCTSQPSLHKSWISHCNFLTRSLCIIQDGTSHPQTSAQQITCFLGPLNVLCPVSCLVGAWVALSLASGTMFFTAVHVNHDLMISYFISVRYSLLHKITLWDLKTFLFLKVYSANVRRVVSYILNSWPSRTCPLSTQPYP